MAANVIGTTGASVLLIRPWIRSNQYRGTGFHIVFFIFIVSNVAGCLTPIGDPPLFLGYLSKVPFWWTLTHFWQPWLFTVSALIGIFYLFDRHNFLRAPAEIRRVETGDEHWVFRGKRNLVLLGFILIAFFLQSPFREAVRVWAALASLRLTPPHVHEANHFNFGPIREVAWIFLMTPDP